MIKTISNSKVHNLILILLSFNLIGGLIWLFGFHNIRLLLLASTGTGLLLIFLFSLNKATVFRSMFVIYIISFSLLLNIYSFNYANLLIDLSSFGILFSVLLLNRIKKNTVYKIILFIFIPSVLYFIYSLSLMDLSLLFTQGIERKVAFNSFGSDKIQGGAAKGQVIYQSQQLIIGHLVLILLLVPLIATQIKKKYLYLIVGVSFAFIIIFSAFYQKRQPIVEIFLVLMLSVIFNRKLLKGLLPQNLLVSFLLFIIIVYFALTSDILGNVIDRFSDTLSNVDAFDRFEESEKVFSQFYWYDWLLGKGMGYSAPNTPGGIILHIGYSNLIMKGGILLLLFYVLQVLKNIKYCYYQSKRYPEFKVGIVISLFSLVQLSYAPGYHWHITTIITGLAMFSRYPLKSLVYDKYYNSRA